jgi:hypothetical protein
MGDKKRWNNVARMIFLIVIISWKGWERNMEERIEGDKGTKGVKQKKKTGRYAKK